MRLSVGEMALFGVLGALTFGLKLVMAPLPNIEPVSLLVMVYGVVFGWRALYPVYLYVLMEILYFGLGTWNINYLYIWGILAAASIVLQKTQNPLCWALLSGAFGLLFGALCAPVDLFIGGPGFAVSKWISGIPFDLLHCGGNFAIALILSVPLCRLLTRLYAGIRK